MAVKGAQLKNEITQKILSTFAGSFLYNDGKEIRINGTEDGLPVQIKVTLTCAKTPVESESIIAVSAEEDAPVVVSNEKVPNEPTEEEKARLDRLLKSLNLD